MIENFSYDLYNITGDLIESVEDVNLYKTNVQTLLLDKLNDSKKNEDDFKVLLNGV